jgi:hypothetical protein
MAQDQRDYMIERERKRFRAWLDKPVDRRSAPRDPPSPWWMPILFWLVIALVIFAGVKRFT